MKILHALRTLLEQKGYSNKALRALAKNQSVLIENNEFFVKDNKNVWSWIQNLQKRVASLEFTISKMKAKDKEFSKMFTSLGSLCRIKLKWKR